jgi:iron complex outermembrane recepter protein
MVMDLLIFLKGSCALGDEAREPARHDPPEEEALTIPDDPLFEASLEGSFETTIVAQRPDFSAGSITVSREQIEQRHPSSADDVLTLVPSLQIVQHGAEGKGHQLFLRGFDAAHGSDVEMSVLGVSLNEPSQVHGQGYADLYGIVPEVISEMDVAKGPFLPWQGDFATAGSVRFDLGVPARLRPGLVRLEAGHRGRLRAVAVVAPVGASEETFAAMEAVDTPGFGPRRAARRAALNAGGGVELGGGALAAFVLAETARFELPGAVRLSDVQAGKRGFYSASDLSGKGLSDRVLGRVGFRRERGPTDVEVFGYGILRQFSVTNNYTGYLQYEEMGDAKTQRQASATAGAEATLEQRLKLPFSAALLFGLGWRFDAIHQAEEQVDEAGIPWQLNRDAAIGIHDVHASLAFRLSPFDWWRVLPSLRVTAIRFDIRDAVLDRGEKEAMVNLSPRIAMSFPVHDRVTVFADWGRGFRAPEARSLLANRASVEDESLTQYTGGTPDFAVCDAVELGVKVEPVDTLAFTITGFATWLEHEMVFDHVSNLNLELNGTRRAGIETEASLKPLSWLEAGGAFTWVHARFARSGNPVPGAPIYLASATLFIGKDDGPHGGVRFHWLGKRALAHGARADGYVLLDVDAGWRVGRLDVTLVIDNAPNLQVMEGAYHFASWFDRSEPRSAIPELHYTAGEPFTARMIVTVYL